MFASGPGPCAMLTHPARTSYSFGPFTLDPARRQLRRHQEPVLLSDRSVDILSRLVAAAGTVVDKETLIHTGWPDTAVSDDSLRQAVNAIRRALGRQGNGADYVEARVKRGYVFTAPVTRIEQPMPAQAIDQLLDAFRTFTTGRSALESLALDRVQGAIDAFDRVLHDNASSYEGHVGMATACVLLFESTRTETPPHTARLAQAAEHAERAVRLRPNAPDAWGTFALVHHRLGHLADAEAAARKAVDLDPADGLHWLRLAAVSWGQARIRAAHRALAENPELVLARWLAATVYVARGLFDRALDELRLGIVPQEVRGDNASTTPGLYWLRGLILAATGDVNGGIAALERELATLDARHVYGRESARNAYGAMAALRLRQAGGRQGGDGHHDFDGSDNTRGDAREGTLDAAMHAAVTLTAQGRPGEAAARVAEWLGHAAPGSTGWLIPVDPHLHVAAHPEAWASVLATLRARAM